MTKPFKGRPMKPARNRRTPVEYLEALEAQQVRIADRYDAITEKIERVKKRYAKSIAMAKFQDTPAEDLAAQLKKASDDQRLLRKALKAKRGQAS